MWSITSDGELLHEGRSLFGDHCSMWSKPMWSKTPCLTLFQGMWNNITPHGALLPGIYGTTLLHVEHQLKVDHYSNDVWKITPGRALAQVKHYSMWITIPDDQSIWIVYYSMWSITPGRGSIHVEHQSMWNIIPCGSSVQLQVKHYSMWSISPCGASH